ncbi:uncharacterized protein LAESUDRAFT_779842 [Laetiporus sulphureus 93-53]|uniref:Protein MON2 homolog n=1 Tax=Laetiporus sulphureus 93-53 TaxID=1314785 RepID=A0A165DX59_9APHY|nr:uncharacterized protein LAESUDRAFT_779842 [Laetiporus sulphureus 93-53]KZT05808.1 hypothetical protein LAESUDRAFT_779842 [Laetiporus sulphureus 93-53]
MSSLTFLVTELQSLASETRRKHPDVREAAEKSLAILRSSPEQATIHLASDGPQSDDLLRPVFMGCATKNAKVVAISLGSLQRLIALKAVPQSTVPLIVTTMNDCVNQGVDIQLRILQTLLSLITNFLAVHSELLGDALLLCFKLQESRIAVVTSTAAATLRQLVMFVVDKVVDEDHRDEVEVSSMTETTLPNGKTKALGPSALDAFAVFQDLCLLADAEHPHFLKPNVLRKTFALELIESVLTNYHDLFRKIFVHDELLQFLQHHLSLLLLKALSDRPNFPLTLRATRQFSLELKSESEVFLMLLIRIVSADGTDGDQIDHAHPHGPRPLWMRVLSMEVMRGLCSDAELMRKIWERYDAEAEGSKIFTSLVTALKRLVTEKPDLLGVCTEMYGVGVPTGSGSSSDLSAYGLDVGGVAGMVANAASATVSDVASMMGSEVGLSMQESAMKLQCIDQLDKADSPGIPEPYIYLLGVQCLRPRAAGEPVMRAPPALNIDAIPTEEPYAKPLRTVHDMVESGWPALLAALSFLISTNLSDELFVDVLASYQALTTVSGMLGLSTPRDAFFTSLAHLAIPIGVLSSLDAYPHLSIHGDPITPRSTASTFSENLGLALTGSAPSTPPGFSERNMACLKVLVSSALFLAGSLGDSWLNILEVLQNADDVLSVKGGRPSASKRATIGPGSGVLPVARTGSLGSSQSPSAGGSGGSQGQVQPTHPLLADLDPESMQHAIQRLFDASKNLDDDAFRDFVNALCKLSAAMVEMQSSNNETLVRDSESVDDVASSPTLSPPSDSAHRRRVSGLQMLRTPLSGDFGISKLGGIATLNIHRLIYRSPEVAWDPITEHLLSVILNHTAPGSVRVQAARVLDDILVVVPRNLSTTVISDGIAMNSSTIEVRRMGFETLHQILQASGHTLVIGWETIFEMLSSVCRPAFPSSLSVETVVGASSKAEPSKTIPQPLTYTSEKGYNTLVKIAFQSLTLVCDSLTSLSPEHLRLCISTLGQFGRQADTNIALTAAESLLWGVSDSIQAKRKDSDKEPEYSELWMFLLTEILGLCTDARPEVRVGANQTLFRTLQLYGATLSLETWDACIWKITFPLLDAITAGVRQATSGEPAHLGPIPADQQWDESKILALQSIGSIFHEFLVSKIMPLASFADAWDVFVSRIRDSWLHDNRDVSATAVRCMDKAIRALADVNEDAANATEAALDRVWRACDEMGEAVQMGGSEGSVNRSSVKETFRPFTQESLMAFVDVIRSMRSVAKSVHKHEWAIEQLERLMAILKGVLTYPDSQDFRPDVDALSPVQGAVLEVIDTIDLNVPGASSLVLRDLSEYVTLPFLAAFDIPEPKPSSVPARSAQLRMGPKQVTYIGLSKKVMPMLVDLFMRFKDQATLYVDGTLERIFSAYGIPIKMKYECPAPSKFGKDPPLWKTATTSFLKIVKECGPQMQALGESIPDDRREAIWRQIVDTFRGGILADCSPADSFPLDVQEEEENFDLALLAALEIDVISYLGEACIPDYLILQLARILHQGSRLRDEDNYLPPSPKSISEGLGKRLSQEFETIERFGDPELAVGSTEAGRALPRERFSYWCFDLLFLICSDTAKELLLCSFYEAATNRRFLLSINCHEGDLHHVSDFGSGAPAALACSHSRVQNVVPTSSASSWSEAHFLGRQLMLVSFQPPSLS